MVDSCPHSIYFFRKSMDHFDFINDYQGNKTAEELTVHPNPLLVPENEGKYYRASESFDTTEDYIVGPGVTVNVGDYISVTRTTDYVAVTPVGTENPFREKWYEKNGNVYVLTTDTTVNPSKTYYEMTSVYKFDDFGDSVTNTFRDWHIMPLGRPTISPAQQKIQKFDIPGANGTLDLSNSLTKYPVFNNRTGSMTFAVDYDKTDWLTAYTKIMRFLQGVSVRMILEDDPLYFYEGAVYVDDFNSRNDGTWSEITLGYDLQPYRRSIYTSIDDDWLWDPFNFETDVIQSSIFSAIQVTDSTSTPWENVREFNFTGLIDTMPVIPELTVDTVNNQPMQAQLYNSDVYGDVWKDLELPEGPTYQLYDLVLCEETPESVVKMRFRNPGTVTLKFRSGRL